MVKIEGLPDFVKVVHGVDRYKNFLYADVYIEQSESGVVGFKDKITTESLGKALLKLAEEGFVYYHFSYDRGYYDSVDAVRLTFTKKPK